MPDVLVGSVEAAEADADPDEAVAPPGGAGCDERLPHAQGPAAVQQHADGLLHVLAQQLRQSVVVLVLPGAQNTTEQREQRPRARNAWNRRPLPRAYQSDVAHRNDEVKERFQPGVVTRGILLDL